MVSPLETRKWLVIACLAIIAFSPTATAAAELVTLEEYGEGDKQFEVFDIGDKMVVYFHQRMQGDAIVEKNYIVYQFDRATGELLDRRSHWRTDLPEELPDIRIDRNRLRTMVERDIQSARLWIISPQSDVFPLDPCPQNPCWVVRSVEDGNLIIEIIDAVTGEYLGNGIPPPYTAFSLTGPIYWNPCESSWQAWSLNAESWFNAMGYSTEQITWPTENQVRGHVQSNETALFYELAHGGSTYFSSGCVGGTGSENTYATEIESWITGYEKMPFTFIGSCDGMCSTGDNTFSYEFRKGSVEKTTVVGYCGMSTDNCATCWSYSLAWQDDLFEYMSLGWPVKDAFDQANANYPTCFSNSCMRFSGDQDFAVFPRVPRVPGPCLIAPLDIDFGALGVGCHLDTTFYVKNKDVDTILVDITETCDHYSIVANGGLHTLAPGESVIVTVRFEPTATGTHDCTIDTGPVGCSSVICTGTADNGCAVNPLHLDFGAVAMGDSADLDFTLWNSGCTTLNGSVTESCMHYEIASGGGAYSLAPGESLTVTVRFKPTLIGGPWACTIQTGTLCANVSCLGLSSEPPPVCLIEPDTLDFGNVDVAGFKMMTFDITNTGYGTLEGTMSDVCPYFDIVTGGTYSLDHDESQTVTVIFFPQTAGPHECTIETGNGACTDVYCMGYGDSEPPPECSVEPDTLDYGVVIVSDSLDMNFDIINSGGGVLSGSVSDTCSYWDVVAGGGAYALSSGETLHVTVRFKPEADGIFECWVETGAECGNVYCTGEGDDVTGLGMVNPNRFYLYQNYPNPFNPSTNITFTVPWKSHTNLSIYNIEGRLVRTLVDGEFAGGVKTIAWDGRDARGNPVSSGVYFYRLRAGGDVMTKKMILLK